MRLRVTATELDYEGSITIGRKLLNGLLDGEKVQVSNMNTGKQFETYVIAGDKGFKEKIAKALCGADGYDWEHINKWYVRHTSTISHFMYYRMADAIQDLLEEGVCVNGAAARLVQIRDEIEVTNGEGG